MNPEIVKWIPLSCVLGACLFLWSVSHPNMKFEEERPIAKMGLPTKPKDYQAPAKMRDPFEASAVAVARPASGNYSPGESSKKRGAGEKREMNFSVDGILWDSASPLASVNGQLVSEGSRLGRARVLKIEPDRVVFLVDGRRVEKRAAVSR